MRTVTPFVLAAAVLASAGCGPRTLQEVDTGSIEVMSWRATLSRPEAADSLAAPMNLAGSVAIRPAQNPAESQATVMLRNATPNATHPWHVHAGTCGNDNGIVGPATAYKPLTVDAQGNAEVSITLPFATPTQGEYFVNVHKSPTELGTIVACGTLEMGVSPMR
jgi:hypothetical protein